MIVLRRIGLKSDGVAQRHGTVMGTDEILKLVPAVTLAERINVPVPLVLMVAV